MTDISLSFLRNHPTVTDSYKKLGYKRPTEIIYSKFLLVVVRAGSSVLSSCNKNRHILQPLMEICSIA